MSAKFLIAINGKAPQSLLGGGAEDIARAMVAVASEFPTLQFCFAPPATLISEISAGFPELLLWAQHTDAAALGSCTGQLPAPFLAQAGARGTLLNHSERRFEHAEDLQKAHQFAKEAGLNTCVCAESADEIGRFAAEIKPDLLAFEPPELIGGTVSVTTRPQAISAALSQSGGVPLLVGAGVKTAQDTQVARELGAAGVLLASGVTSAADPAAALRQLAQGATA